jgi:hypothetical protein
LPERGAAPAILALLAGIVVAGCGSGSHSGSTLSSSARAQATTAPARTPPPAPLTVARALSLPAGRSGTAAAAFGSSIVISGGISPAGVSTATVFRIDARGKATVITPLPGPIHDAAAAELDGRLLTLGGGRSEGSDRIIQVLPTPRQIGTLPQALSDLDAVVLDGVAYVLGGWNGSVTNRHIYAVRADGSAAPAGAFPTGVRYPAAGALGGQLLVAGGETTSGAPTSAAWSFDPATRRLMRLPDLPSPTDHAAGATLAGRFYVLGGLRRGLLTSAIVSWAPGESRWRQSGRLPTALADLAAVPFDRGIAVIGGRGSTAQVSTVTVMKLR